jgi:glycosyltransferase involved in cell wall biosynthesis
MATQNPTLTIIVPVFRAEKTLQASLDSVLSQEFRDWELLVLDGASPDGTLAIAQEAARKDDRIRVISEPDKGVYDAMNKGIARARGEWLYFLGSDDLLYDDTVLSSVMGARDADLLYGNVVSPSYKGVYDGPFDYPKLLSRNLSHQAAFYRKTLFSHLGDYNLRYKAYADWDLNLRCFSDPGLRIRYIDRIVGRFGADGLSSRHDIPFLKEVLFPARLRMLLQTGPRVLRRLSFYDEWWRLLRNAQLRGRAALRGNPESVIPAPIGDMAAWQGRISPRWLKIGVCSKMCMFASYLRHLITGAI